MPTIHPPFDNFTDADGLPLDAGKIYIGSENQNPETNPISVYWDAAMTQPAAQPIRTTNGLISRNGKPAQLFASEVNYSMTVRTTHGALVYSELFVSPMGDFAGALAAAIHAAPLDAAPSELDEIGIWDSVTGLLRKITFTFLQSGAGALLMTVRRALRLNIWAEQFGADPTASAATNNAAFAAAITEALARGGDVVNIGPGTYNISATIILPSKVYLQGRGSKATQIFLANNSNCDMMQTTNFLGLTGTNAELISEGIVYACGFNGIRFNGNRPNQLSGNGIRMFAKRYHIGDDVMIVDAKEIAFYSEAGDKGGQNEPDDMPEGLIEKLLIYLPGKEGFVFNGPHDAIIHKVSVSQAGQDAPSDGVRFDRKVGVWNGICYVTGHIHSYASKGRGIVLRCPIHANILTGESCWQEGVVLETTSANWVGCYYATINTLEAYNNDQADTRTYWHVDIHGQHNLIGKVRISNSKQAKGGLHIDGNGNIIGGGNILGNNAIWNGTAVELDANFLNVNVNALNYNVAGDIGLSTKTLGHCRAKFTGFECDTGWSHTGVSAHNNFEVIAYSAAGATKFTDGGTGTFGADTFDIRLVYGATFGFSNYAGAASLIQNGTLSTTINHLGFRTPRACDIQITPTDNWSNAGVARTWWLSNITATQFTINVDVAAPVTHLHFEWRMRMS